MDNTFVNPIVPIHSRKMKLEKAEWTPDGFVTTWDSMPPRKGLMLTQNGMPLVDSSKNAIMTILKLIKETPLKFFLLLPSVRNRVIKLLIEQAYKPISVLIMEDNKWCKSGQELARVLEVNRLGNETPEIRILNELKWKARVTFLALWEYDESYRYRGQDIYEAINLLNLSENPRKELLRAIKLGYERDNDPSMKQKWKLLRFAVMFAPPKIIRKISDTLLKIYPERMKLDSNDKEWARNKDYQWGFLG